MQTERIARLKDDVAIVGVGHTDYVRDHRDIRDGNVSADSLGYAVTAFKRAMADAGLARSDIDGLIVGSTLSPERVGETLGIDPRWSGSGDIVNALLQAITAIHSGLADCIALIYGNNQRSKRKQYGGAESDGSQFLAYVNYAPWGLTSQGALYALTARRYMELYGLDARQLAQVAVCQRQYASLNDDALMRKPITVDDYLASPYICEPLRLLDYCLVNDGGVALILTSRDYARRLPSSPVLVSGIGRSEIDVRSTSLEPRLIDFYHSAHTKAAEAVFGMAGVEHKDIDLLQIYDSFSVHVPIALEGFGYCRQGEVGGLLVPDCIGPGGRMPVNTSGGHLSETYMQGWNHQVEIVKQLRGMAGKRQVDGARHAQYISDVAGKVISLIYRRGDA